MIYPNLYLGHTDYFGWATQINKGWAKSITAAWARSITSGLAIPITLGKRD